MDTTGGHRKKRETLSITNLLSVGRAVSGLAVGQLIVIDGELALDFAVLLMVAIAVLDSAGDWARRDDNHGSLAERILEPVSRGVYAQSIFLAFVAAGWMHVWLFLAVFVRDLSLAYFKAFAAQASRPLAARLSDRAYRVARTAGQLVVVAAAAGWLGAATTPAATVAQAAILVVGSAAIWSLVDNLTSLSTGQKG